MEVARVPREIADLLELKGQVGAALYGEMPQLLEISQIKGDLQVHSDWSDGSKGLRWP
ncbi:MAG: hypothetical protein AB1815_12310 [Bacillota bacterium]